MKIYIYVNYDCIFFFCKKILVYLDYDIYWWFLYLCFVWNIGNFFIYDCMLLWFVSVMCIFMIWMYLYGLNEDGFEGSKSFRCGVVFWWWE